jgi:heptosyltransferase-3
MSLPRVILNLIAAPLRVWSSHRPQIQPTNPRILIIRRNRMGDMIYTLPLFHALRRHYPNAHLAVACDPAGEPIARACVVIDEVIVLQAGLNRWTSLIRHATRLQNYDWALAAKGGFDRRLAALTRLTNAAIRIGFEPKSGEGYCYFTHPVALASAPHQEHQIETLLRLLAPLDVPAPAFNLDTLKLTLPETSRQYAATILAAPPFAPNPSFVLLNISCNRPVKFRTEDYATLVLKIVRETSLAIGIVSAPEDRAAAQSLATSFSTERVATVPTPGPLDLAALLERAQAFITPEGGAAHLSSATQTPTVVLWAGHYGKWRPRGEHHVLVEALNNESLIPVDRTWETLKTTLKI